jgi:hypothetical protein
MRRSVSRSRFHYAQVIHSAHLLCITVFTHSEDFTGKVEGPGDKSHQIFSRKRDSAEVSIGIVEFTNAGEPLHLPIAVLIKRICCSIPHELHVLWIMHEHGKTKVCHGILKERKALAH